jgi:serine/threonine-protein kinase SRPK3
MLTRGSLHQWVALKIMTAAMTETSRELRWYDALGAWRPDSPYSKYVVRLLDHFIIEGPNGAHLVLAFELMGPNVRSIVKTEYHDRADVDPTTILKMTEQVLKALEFIHQTGFAHGGMVHYLLVSGPVRTPLPHCDWAPDLRQM